jgi:hypothetical protein
MKPVTLSTCLWAVVLASPAIAAVIEVQVPAHSEWCKMVTVSDVAVLGTAAGQGALFRSGQEPIADCARFREISQIGVPYVRGISQNAPGVPEVRLEFCSVVAGTSNPCEGIELRSVAVASFLAAVCAQAASADCQLEIANALKGEPWKLTDAAVEAVAWRFVQTGDPASTPAAILKSLQGTTMQLGFSDAPAVTVASYIVVAAPVPPVPAPAENGGEEQVPEEGPSSAQ